MRRVLIVLSVLVVALSAAACSGGDSSSRSSTTETVALTGANWVLTDTVSLGTPLGTTAVSATFDHKSVTVSGSAWCNAYNAPYTTSGSTLTIGPNVATTQRACEPGPTAVEREYLARLVKVASYEIAGDTLTLSGSSGTKLLGYRVSEGADVLLGGWNATSIYTGNAIESPAPGSAMTLEFADGRVSGNSGCNTFGGAYELSGHDGITIGPLQTTLVLCADPAASTQEQQYTAALELARTYRVAGDQLTLFRPGGTIAATFERATGLTSGS